MTRHQTPIPQTFVLRLGTAFLHAVLLLAVLLPAGASATETSPAGEPAPDATGTSATGAAATDAAATFAFTRAKLLADEGDLMAAAEAFDEAIGLSPDAYGFVEAAKFQLYLAQIARERDTQQRHYDRAAELMDQAFQLAPQNRDVLRVYADVQWRRAEQDPGALERARAAFEVLADDGDIQALISLAQIHLWQREPDQAADLLTQASDLAPRHPMIQGMLVEALLGAGRDDEAEGALRILLELEPGRVESRVRLVELLGRRGAHGEAVEVLQGAPEDFRDRLRIRQLLARELHLSGRHREALEISDSMLADDPRSPGYFRLRMSILVSLARYREAIEVLEPHMATADDAERRAQDVLLVSRLLERVGRGDEAADRLRSELASASKELKQETVEQMTLALAGVLQRGGQPQAAAALLEPLASEAQPRDLALLAQSLAELWLDAGEDERAMAVTDDAIRRLEAQDEPEMARALRLRQLLDLSDVGSWEQLLSRIEAFDSPDLPAEVENAKSQLRADALAGLGRVEEAVNLLGRGDEPPELRAKRLQLMLRHGQEADAMAELETLASSGDRADLLFVARVLQSQDLHERAVPILEQVVSDADGQDDGGNGVATRFMYGAALERTGRFDDAARVFEQILDRDPDHTPTLNYLGYMWAERAQNLDRALDLIVRAVAAEPDNGAYVDSLGWAYFQLGRYDEAIQHLEWASRLEKEDPTVFHHLGDAYAALGQSDDARAAYERALELDASSDAPQELNEENRLELRRKLKQLDRSGP